MKKTIAILLALLLALQIAVLPASAADESSADVPTLSTVDAVASYIRAEMVKRSAEIRYKVSGFTAAFGATLNKICAHTGNGAEGDYLRLALNYVFPQPVKDADGVYTLHPVYYTTAEQEAAVDAYVENVVAGCTAQDSTEIARYLYDYLCEHVTFDLENLYNDEDMLKYTAYGAAINGKAVCQGFASLYYKLALAAGLDCRIVTGTRGDVAHAWNIIKVGDLWYHVDASSGAQLLDNSAYFMKRLFDGCTIHYGDETAAEIQNYSFVRDNADDEIVTATYNGFTYTLNKTTGELVVSGTGDLPQKLLQNILPSDADVSMVKSAVISEGVTSLFGNFFYLCKNLSQISLPATLTTIDDGAFSDSPVKADAVHLNEANPSICLLDGCLIDKNSKKLLLGSDEGIIPSNGSVETICSSAFRNCTGLMQVCIPISVKKIGDVAFCNCTNLQTISFSNRYGAEYTFGLNVFSGCSGLTEIDLPEGLKSIEILTFQNCTSLKNVCLPGTVNAIAASAFSNCWNMETITVAAGNARYTVKNNCLIDMNTKTLLAGCSNSVIPDDGSVTKIGTKENDGYPFNGCENLDRIVIPEGVTSVNGFNGCTGLTEVVFPNSVTEIHGFSDCPNLSSVTFPDQLTEITGFRNCTALQRIDLPDTVRVLGNDGYGAFYGCSALTSVKMPAALEVMYAFRDCPGLTTATIPSKCSLVYMSFDNCVNLKELIVLSKSVRLSFDRYAPQPDCIIFGFEGSTAESFARSCNLAFVPLCPQTNEPHKVQAVDATDPDCLNPGYTAGTVCPDCGEWLSGHEVSADALGHNPGAPVPENVVAATCTAEGSYDNVTRCTRCNIVLSSTAELIAMTPHADNDRNGYCDDCGAYICEHPETALQNAKAPTCTEAGYSGDTVCGYCGVTLTYGVTLPATGHSPVISAPAKDATCLDAGQTAAYTCSVCNAVTTAAKPTPLAAHTDADSDGLCDVCLAPIACTQYGRCGDDLFWYVDGGVLVISGSGASGTLDTTPWETYSAQIDAAYLRDSVTAMDGAPFAACPHLDTVYAAAATTVSRCSVPVLTYTDANGVCTVSGRNNVPTMDLPALLNTASILCIDRTVTALRFDRLSLCATDDGQEIVYDILKNGKIIDENHFRLPSGTLLNDFSMKALSYASFNSAFDAIAEHPDRNLILSLACTDLLPAELQADSESYTEQFVLHFVDEPVQPDTPDEPAAEKTALQKIVERFQATLAAILSIFKKLFRLFKR